MATDETMTPRPRPAGWTKYVWIAAALLLSIPFVAMRFTSEVDWTASDFVFVGLLLALVCGAVELTVRTSANWWVRLGAFLGIAASFIVIWVNMAVGIVGSTDNPANLLFFGAVLVAIIGSVMARLRPRGMARAMSVAGSALLVALVIAKLGPHDEPMASKTVEWIGTGIFAGLYFLSALAFRHAARGKAIGA